MFRADSTGVFFGQFGLGVALLTISWSSAFGQDLTSYHIGNSLTWDARPSAFDDYSAQRGFVHEVGYHIRSSKSLTYIVEHPQEHNIDPTDFGLWAEALPNHAWDVITMQIHPSDQSTLDSDTDAAVTLIDTALAHAGNAQTHFVLYGAWPQTPGDYAEKWLEDIDADDGETLTSHTRAFQQALYERVRAERPGVQLSLISLGELLYLADQRIKQAVALNSDWYGFTDVDELYRDGIHMNYGEGRWLASTSLWAAVTGEEPQGLVPPDGEFGGSVDDELLRQGLTQFVSQSYPSIYLPEPGTLVFLGLGWSLVGRRSRGRAASNDLNRGDRTGVMGACRSRRLHKGGRCAVR